MVHDSAEGDFSFRDYLSCKLNFVKWPPCGTDPETSRTKKASWLGRCCRRLKSTGEEPDLEAGVPPAVSKTHSKISRGNSVSFASAPSSTSANEELMSHAVPFDPEEFLRPVCQSDLVDRFYSKLAAEYEAAAAASASGLAEEGLLPWRDSGAAFSLSPTTKSENMASSRSWNVGPADSSSYAATRRASSLGDASAFGRLDAEDTEPSHVPSKDDEGQSPKAAPEVQLEHNPERSPPARPSRPSRSAPLISLESIDDVNVEVIRSPSGQVKQKHLVFAMVEEEPVFKTALKSVQFVGVDSNAPEESPTRNRLADGAGPLPPREEKAIETSPRGDAEVTSCVQDVHIELDLEDKKKERRRESTSSAESKTVPRVPRVSDEDALAALEVAQWQPRKDQTKVPTQCSLSTEEREDSPSPLPSPPVAPATPAPGASPGPSRSRAAAAAAAAAAAMTGAAAGARSAMSAAGNRVSIGGAALATLVSPEAAPDRASRSSVFSGRFMPLSLWAQAESTTPPPSGPGSPEQKQDVKLSEVLDGDSPVQEGEKKAERLQKMPSKESAGAAEADAAHCGHATLPTPPIAPAERKGATRGSSAPPDPCRSKSDGEEERAVLPRPMSADSMAEKDRKAVSSMKLVVTPTKEADASPPFTASLASTSSPVRGRQGSKHMTSTSRGHLSPSPAGPATPQDSKVEREAREELQISRSNSRPPAESPKDGAEREEVLPDVLFSAPPAEPDDRISTTRMPSVVPTEAGDTPRAAFAEATETRAIEVVEAETATPSPHSEELRASQVESRESQESHVSSIESASPERRRHTHFLGPCQSAQTSRSRSGSRKSCIASVGPEHPELRVSTSLSGPEGNSDGLRARMPSRPCFADRSASPVTDEVLPVNTVDFTFACADDGVDDAAGPTATRSEEETTIAEDTQASDGWCMSNSSTAVGADVKIFRREEHRPEMESTVDPFEVKRIETRKEVEELEPSFAEEADPKTASETSAAAWGTLDEDHFSEGLDARKSVPRGRRKEAKEARRQRNRGRSTSYQDALDCLRLQAGLGMELTVCR